MGRGDQYQQPRFTVPMATAGDWPFPERRREFCPLCERPTGFCECSKSQRRRVAAQQKGK